MCQPAPPVIWQRATGSTLGRPALRTRAEITAAAIAIADAEGLDAVSMRRVAHQLGTGAASLYRHIATREDLLDLMLDEPVGEVVLRNPSDDWRGDIVDLALQTRRVLLRHPWLGTLIGERQGFGPRQVTLLEHVLRLLAGCPLRESAKLQAFGVVTAVVALFVQHERLASAPGDARHRGWLDKLAQGREHPRLAQAIGELLTTEDITQEERLRDVVRGVLAGLLPEPVAGG